MGKLNTGIYLYVFSIHLLKTFIPQSFSSKQTAMRSKVYLCIALLCFPLVSEGQFIAKPLNFSDTLYNVYTYSIIDENHAWFGVDHIDWTTMTLYNYPYAVKTSDGGDTWQFDSIPMAGSIIAVQELSAVDTNVCYYVLTDSDVSFYVWKTTDGGNSWTQKTTSQFSGVFIDFIHAFSADTVTAFGDVNGGYWEIEYSVDGGDSWTRVPSANIPAPLGGEYSNWRYHSVRGDTVWFATSRGRCYRSVDKGLTWTVSSVISVNGIECDVKFASAMNGVFFKSAMNGGIKISSDGGQTWTDITIQGSNSIISASPVAGWPAGFIYSTPTSVPGMVDVYFTPDHFNTNLLVSQGIASIGHLSFLNASTGWLSGAGTETFDIYKYDGLLTAINDTRKDDTHMNIIPNPSRNSAMVWLGRGNGPGPGNISVFDVSGRMVYRKIVAAESEWTDLDASSFSNGFYEVVYISGIGESQTLRWIVQH